MDVVVWVQDLLTMGLWNGRETTLMCQWDVIYVLPEGPPQSGLALTAKVIVHLDQWFSNGGNFVPQRILVTSGDLFGWPAIGIWWVEARDTGNQSAGWLPPCTLHPLPKNFPVSSVNKSQG